MAQISVKATTDSSHGHTLGCCSHVMRSYCAACTAGCGMCYHRAGLFWMQLLHWGEGRPTPKPSTSGFCSWNGGRSERTCKTTEPASRANREKLPGSNEEAQKKLDNGVKRSMHEGLGAKYEVYGSEDERWDKLNDARYISKDRINNLFLCLRAEQNLNRRC